MYKVNIVGAGFVGLTLAEVLSNQQTVGKVTVIDVSEERINDLKSGKIPVKEDGLNLKSKKLNFTSDYAESDGDIFFVCVGTPDMDGSQNLQYLISAVTEVVSVNPAAILVIKSTTLPNNLDVIKKYIDPVRTKLVTNPEFLAEGKAVSDMKNQDQLIIGFDDGVKSDVFDTFKKIFKGTYKSATKVGLHEAMIIKYFLNSYKAMKLTFVNEFDTYCRKRGYSFKEVIESIKDPVMGTGFDKPGVAFGGSCFPKDTHAIGKFIPLVNTVNRINNQRIIMFADSLLVYISDITDSPSPVLLFVGKAFKNGTNDVRDSVSVKVFDRIKNAVRKIYFYDEVPELSDLTYDELVEYKDKFDAIVIFNENEKVEKLFEGDKRLINTRLIK